MDKCKKCISYIPEHDYSDEGGIILSAHCVCQESFKKNCEDYNENKEE